MCEIQTILAFAGITGAAIAIYAPGRRDKPDIIAARKFRIEADGAALSVQSCGRDLPLVRLQGDQCRIPDAGSFTKYFHIVTPDSPGTVTVM